MNENSRLSDDAKRDLAIAALTNQTTALTALVKKYLNNNLADMDDAVRKISSQIKALDKKIDKLYEGTVTVFEVPTPDQMKKIAKAAGDIGSVVGTNRTLQAVLEAAVKIGKMYKPA